MTKRYYYENLCDALYMAHHFGWEFYVNYGSDLDCDIALGNCGLLVFDDGEDAIDINDCSAPFCLQDKYHKEVEPRMGDLTDIKGLVEPYPGIYENHPDFLALAEILQRDDKPFIIPMVEEIE